MTTAARPIAETTMKMPSLMSALPYALGGVGMAALENRYIAPDQPQELKKVNLGIGGITGYLLTSPDPKVRFAALASIPTKQLGLFGIGAADKLRRQQQSLVDANLDIANINKRTAQTQADNAAATGRLALMFLLPAMAAGGALGYMGYEKWKKRRATQPRYRTVGEKGRSRSGQKIKIDIPATALPREFFESLVDVDDSARARTRLLQLTGGAGVGAGEEYAKAASADAPVSVPGLLGSLAYEFTGIPGATRTMKDLGLGLGSFTNEQFGEAGRYGTSAAGNALLTLLTLKTGTLPILGKLLGRRFLTHQSRGLPGVTSRRSLPTISRWMYPYAYGNSLGPRNLSRGGVVTAAQRAQSRAAMGLSLKSPVDRLLQMRGRVDPNRFSWTGATSTNPIFKQLFTSRGTVSPTLPGQAYNAMRYGGNRAWNLAYRAGKFGVRHPIISALALGLPLAGLGSQRDENRAEEARRSLHGWIPDWENKTGPRGMPVSAALSGVMSAFGGNDGRGAIRRQMEGASWDPWAASRP